MGTIISSDALQDLKIIIRGAGEMATGTAVRLYRSGFRKLLMTEIERPLAVRRLVSFCEAIYEGQCQVENVTAVRLDDLANVSRTWENGRIAVIVDPQIASRDVIKPDVVIDATLAKKNLGTSIRDASLVIALGPGFFAGKDAHWVIETNRGHNLGRLILEGAADPDTGIPGPIGGETVRRVIRAPENGIFEPVVHIGTMVEEEQTVGYVGAAQVNVRLRGVLRGIIRPRTPVTRGLKIGDVDPRGDPGYCSTISEKARAIGGTVLEAILMRFNT
ncbi:MAG: selenium-dependent molybdenum cofactor biosynthesis protein YqeB [Desulfomonilaceae bacterium]